jgi:hypothetical protein
VARGAVSANDLAAWAVVIALGAEVAAVAVAASAAIQIATGT